MTTEVAIATVPVEIQWAIHQFCIQGFDADTTEFLIKMRIDHHETDALLRAGCSHSLAVEILV